uniref:Uncharacterized protein n=1 Tax=Cyprinus carpio TaxID=7962 RepID=A0A8C2CCD2_CYPCA
MSFPPHLNRPQIGIPTMPPGIPPPQFAGFPPSMPPGTPMIPVHMGIMTPAPAVLVPTSMPVISKVAAPRKESTAQAKDGIDGSGPTTTVFVGNISEKASDMLIRQLLARLVSVSTKSLNLLYDLYGCCMSCRLEKRNFWSKSMPKPKHNWMSGKQRRRASMKME